MDEKRLLAIAWAYPCNYHPCRLVSAPKPFRERPACNPVALYAPASAAAFATDTAADTAPAEAQPNGAKAKRQGAPLHAPPRPPRLSMGARKAVYVSLGGNLVLFGGKLVLGWQINSLSVVADAFHSLSDGFTTLLVLLGLWAAAKAPDAEHPFGHGRAEYVGTLVLAVLLVVAGFELGRAALLELVRSGQSQVEATPLAIIIIFGAFGLKLAMARYVQGLAAAEGSNLIGADALHHLMDAVTSLAVGLGLVGVAAGYPVLDDLLGLVVAGVVVCSGLALGTSAASLLLGREARPELQALLAQEAEQVAGVHAPHNIWVHDYGSTVAVALHVGVDADLTLRQAHKLAREVEARLAGVVKGPVMVHLDPWPESDGTESD